MVLRRLDHPWVDILVNKLNPLVGNQFPCLVQLILDPESPSLLEESKGEE